MGDLVQAQAYLPQNSQAFSYPLRQPVVHFSPLEVPTALAYDFPSYLVPTVLGLLPQPLSPILHLPFEDLQSSGLHMEGGQATLSLSIPGP